MRDISRLTIDGKTLNANRCVIDYSQVKSKTINTSTTTQSYTVEQDGLMLIHMRRMAGGYNVFISLNGISLASISNDSPNFMRVCMPLMVKKGDIISVYDNGGSYNMNFFTYAFK